MSDKIPSVGDAIIIMVTLVLTWLLVTGLTMWAVRSAADHTKRAKSAIKKDFPYFTYPFYKKMFFMGLKGALSKVNLVFIWVSFISTILYLIISTVWLVFFNIFSANILYAVSFVSGVSTMGRMLVLRLSWPDFKQANIKKE